MIFMIKYMDPQTPKEFMALHNLPVVVELIEGNQRKIYFIEDHRSFHNDFPSFEEMGGPFPPYDTMKNLAEKHGKEISSDEFEKGEIMPSTERITGGTIYREYRFKKEGKVL